MRTKDPEGGTRSRASSIRASRRPLLASSWPWFITAGLSLALTVAAAASSYFPEFYHMWEPRPGAWSTYHILDGRGETAQLTFAVVDEEAGQTWLELRTKQDGYEGVAAFLVKGDPTDDANVMKVRVKNGDGPAMELDRATLEKLRTEGQSAFGGQAAPIGPTMGKLEGLPDASVEVGGRSLKCRHLKVVAPDGRYAEVWMNDKVAPFGLVKLSTGTEEVRLLDFGKGAKPMLKGPFTPLTVQ